VFNTERIVLPVGGSATHVLLDKFC